MEDLIFNQWGRYLNPYGTVTLIEFINKISNGDYKDVICKLRNEYQLNGKSDLYKEYKKSLNSVTLSGEFPIDKREAKYVKKYFGLMILDVDSIKDEETLQIILNKSKETKYTKIVFRSPTGNGLKILVATNNTDSKKHTECYKTLLKYYESILDVEFDSSTCDVSRLCYYSYDPDIYYNKYSEVFNFQISEQNYHNESSDDIFDNEFVIKIKYIINFTNNVTQFVENNRNNYIYLLGKNSCGYGMDKKNVIEYCKIYFFDEDFSEYEIELAIENGYIEKKSDFGKYKHKLNDVVKNTKSVQNNSNNDIRIKPQIKNITFEDDVFQQYYDDLSKTFPKKYTDFIQSLKSQREKEIVILTMMTVLNSIYQTEV